MKILPTEKCIIFLDALYYSNNIIQSIITIYKHDNF